MDLFEVARFDARTADKARGLGQRSLRTAEGGKAPLDLRDDRVVIDRAGRRDDHVGRPVVAREIGAQAARVEGAHGLGGAEDRAADRLARKRHGLEIFEDQIVGRIFGRADLLHDHVLLARKLLRLEGRVSENVRENIERERNVDAQHAGKIGRALDARRGIEVAADRLDLLGDLPRGAARRALERHVLEEMRNAVLVLALVAAARADPDAERGALQVRHRVGDDREARGQPRDVHAHAAAPSRAARLAARMKRSTAA